MSAEKQAVAYLEEAELTLSSARAMDVKGLESANLVPSGRTPARIPNPIRFRPSAM